MLGVLIRFATGSWAGAAGASIIGAPPAIVSDAGGTSMEFYLRYPANAIEGMQGLSLEQIGVYNLLLDHLYCRDGVLANNDELIRCMLNLDPRRWRRLKAELMTAGKIRVTVDGRIEANGVTSTLLRAEVRSTSQRHRVNVRWKNTEKAKQNNETSIHSRNTTKTKTNTKNSSTSSNAGASSAEPTEPPASVVAHNGSSSGGGSPLSQAEQNSLLRAFERLNKTTASANSIRK